jgi:hypothetical protein
MSFPEYVVGYHAGPLEVLRAVVNSGVKLIHSSGEREWLGGTAVYFWLNGKNHGVRWAEMGRAHGWLPEPAVLQTRIRIGNCLDFLEDGWQEEIDQAFNELQELCKRLNVPLPENTREMDGILMDRRLDCATIDLLHFIRRLTGKPPYDTVICAFPDGPNAFPGSSLRTRSHIQIGVRNYDCLSEPKIVWPPEHATP